jgi:hypothetical protein
MTDLAEIQRRINAIVGQSVDVTEGDDDWNLRSSYINRSQRDWSETFDWNVLYKEYNSITSLASANPTISLPSDYRKIATSFKANDGSSTHTYPEINPQDRGKYETTDKYSYILGDPSGGFNLIMNPGDLPSGASINYSYYRLAPSLVSGSDVSLCQNPEYLVQKSLYYYFLANEDARFSDASAKADQILSNLLEYENVNNIDSTVKRSDDSFVWGKS